MRRKRNLPLFLLNDMFINYVKYILQTKIDSYM